MDTREYNREQLLNTPHIGQDVVTALKRFLFSGRLTRAQRRTDREFRRRSKSAVWPYCGARQIARYSRQVREGRLKAENGLVT